MTKIRVEGYTSLIRDVNSNAIVNASQTEFSSYMSKYKARQKQGDELRSTVKEINNLKTELKEIKKLLKEVLEK